MSSDHPLAGNIPAFHMTDFLFQQALQGVEESGATFRLDEATNNFRGIAAHLVISRHGLARSLDIKVPDLPWKDIGEAYEAGFVERDEFPALATIRAAWASVSTEFLPKLASMSTEILERPGTFPLPGKPETTMLDMVQLSAVHESYHIGQLGLMAKILKGRGPMTPPS